MFQRAKIQDKCKQFTTKQIQWYDEQMLFQRAKIQDKCKQFTTLLQTALIIGLLFQRAKIQDKCKQFTTQRGDDRKLLLLFQRAKIQDKCKQFTTMLIKLANEERCFKEQRYKINASNSQRKRKMAKRLSVVSKSKDTR